MAGLKSFLQNCKKIIFFVTIITAVITLFSMFSSGNGYKLDTEAITKHNRDQIYDFVNDKELNSTQDGRAVILAYRSLTCIVNGIACLHGSEDPEEDYNRSIFGFITNISAYPLSTPPASGIYWAQTQLENVGFVPKSYAAEGIGFAGIRAYQKIWTISRDLAYIVLVLVVTIIGFLIMFRVKVNPQTIISLENALPRIIVTLVLITFSFAIAGFLIDLMYLLIALIITQLTQLNIKDFAPSDSIRLINQYSMAKVGDVWNPTDGLYTIGANFLGIMPYMIRNVFQGILALFAAIYLDNHLIGKFVKEKVIVFTENVGGGGGGGISIAGFGGSAQVSAALGKIIPGIGGAILSIAIIALIWPFLAPLLLGFIVFLSILFLVFRVFFLVLKVYVTIILLIIFAPMMLLLHAVPGKNMFSKWFRSLAANLLVFPTIILLILIASILGSLNVSGGTWQPPFVYGISTKSFSTLLALGMLLIIPDMVKAMKAALGVKESPLKFGFGMFFGGASGAGGGALEQLSKFGYMGHGMQTVQNLLKGLSGKKSTPS